MYKYIYIYTIIVNWRYIIPTDCVQFLPLTFILMFIALHNADRPVTVPFPVMYDQNTKR